MYVNNYSVLAFLFLQLDRDIMSGLKFSLFVKIN